MVVLVLIIRESNKEKRYFKFPLYCVNFSPHDGSVKNADGYFNIVQKIQAGFRSSFLHHSSPVKLSSCYTENIWKSRMRTPSNKIDAISGFSVDAVTSRDYQSNRQEKSLPVCLRVLSCL